MNLAARHRRILTLVLALVAGAGGCGSRAQSIPTATTPRVAAPLSGPAYAAYLRGRVALIEGRYDESVGHYRQAMALAPQEPRIAAALLDALRKSGRRGEARDAVETLTKRWRDQAAVWAAAGAVYRWFGDGNSARAAHARAFALDAGDEAITLSYVQSLAGDAERRERAKDVYRQHLARRSRSHNVRLELALLLVDGGELSEAERELRAVVEAIPDHLVARVKLATVLRLRGDQVAATEMLRRTFERSGRDLGVAEFLFLQLLESGADADARRVLELVDQDQPSRDRSALIGEWELLLGQPSAALKRFETLTGVGDPVGELGVIRSLIALGRTAEAEARALTLSTDDAAIDLAIPALLAAAKLASLRGDDQLGLDRAERAHAAAPTRADALATLVAVAEIAGKVERARTALETAIQQPTVDPARVRVYAAFAARDGRIDRAIELLATLVRFDPSDLESKNELGFVLADHNRRLSDAEALLLETHRELPLSAAVLDSLCWLRHRQGRRQEAGELCERAARLAPAEPEILLHLGALRAESGDHVGALSAFELAAKSTWNRQIKAKAHRQIRALAKKE